MSEPTDAGTFCVIPFTQLIVRSDGAPQVCNRFADRVSRGGRPLSISDLGTAEVWNSTEIRQVRRAMVEGRRVLPCRQCYAEEDSGAVSLRQHMNRVWSEGFLNDRGLLIEELKESAARDGFRAGPAPRFLQLDIGNRCNLACRMCNSGASSRINRDPVHRAWTGPSRDLVTDPGLWFKKPDVIRDVLGGADHLRQLHIIGGEPFLIDEIGTVLGMLVDAGAAPHIELSLHTNATTTRARWLPLIEHFQRVVMYVSVDGYAEDYEYIRFPAKWTTFVANLAELKALPNTSVRAHVVVQNYNVLRIVRLFEFLDAAEVPISALLLDNPPYLRASVLPERARELAGRRLRAYADSPGCRPKVREAIAGIANFLDRARDPGPLLLRDFMLFTNDLDRSRGQRLATVNPELMSLLTESGLEWTEDTRHAATTRHESAGASRCRIRDRPL